MSVESIFFACAIVPLSTAAASTGRPPTPEADLTGRLTAEFSLPLLDLQLLALSLLLSSLLEPLLESVPLLLVAELLPSSVSLLLVLELLISDEIRFLADFSSFTSAFDLCSFTFPPLATTLLLSGLSALFEWLTELVSE